MVVKNQVEYVKNRLLTYSREQVIFSYHAEIRMQRRQISKEHVLKEILNPKKLQFAISEVAKHSKEEKFDCYFGHTKNLCYRYVLILTKNVIVVTVVKIQKRWQARAERKLAKTT